MASGKARPGARKFTVRSERGSTVNGICSNPFLEHAYRTLDWSITVSVKGPRTFSYEQETLLRVRGRKEPFRHTDRNTLHRIAAPRPNPTARRRQAGPALAARACRIQPGTRSARSRAKTAAK